MRKVKGLACNSYAQNDTLGYYILYLTMKAAWSLKTKHDGWSIPRNNSPCQVINS